MLSIVALLLLALSCPAFIGNAQANTIKADESAVRIMAYYGVGHEDSPATSVTLRQFKSHLRELDKGGYNVVALPDVLNAYNKNAPLPKNSVLITFDGSEKSILTQAAPLLKKYKYPFTVFLAPRRIRDNNPRYLNIKDIKRLQKLQLVNFGIHPENYNIDTPNDKAVIRKNLNNAVAFYRDIFGEQPKYFAFPHGLYSQLQSNIVKGYGFKALFGQQSGVAYHNKKGTIHPRFVMTENYADKRRFKMAANALPFPAKDITPNSSTLTEASPSIGLTTVEKLNLNKLSCYASTQAKPHVETLGNRIEIRLKKPINSARFRMNCTLPVINEEDDKSPRWRWFGLLLNKED